MHEERVHRCSFRAPGRGRNKYKRHWAKQRVHRARKARGETAESMKKRKMERRARNKEILQMVDDDADAAHKVVVSATRIDSATLQSASACPPSHTKLETLTKAMVDELRRNVVVAKGAKGSDGGVEGGHAVASGHNNDRYVLDCAPFWYLVWVFLQKTDS